MLLRCRICGSKDLWQPRRHMSTFDHMLSAGGYQRVDCRSCKNRFVVSIADWKKFLKASTATNGRPPASVRVESVVAAPSVPAGTIIGRSVLVHGEVHSGEDIQVYGELEGTVDVSGCEIVIEPGGTIAASVLAGYVVIHGVLRADNATSDHITVCRDGSLIGDVKTTSLVVEEGAYLRGRLET